MYAARGCCMRSALHCIAQNLFGNSQAGRSLAHCLDQQEDMQGTDPPLKSCPSMSLSTLNISVFCIAVENLTDDNLDLPIAVENLTDDNLEAVRQADSLEGQLMDEMEDRETDVSPWGILNRLSPLLFAWVSNQLIMLNDWSGRIQGTEDWKPVTHQRGCARLALCVLVALNLKMCILNQNCRL